MLATRTQRMSEAAYSAVSSAKVTEGWSEFRSFALSFPALIHTAGLCQAIAIAQADNGDHKQRVVRCVLDAVNAVRTNRITSPEQLASYARTVPAEQYMSLTREIAESATLIKRYTEVLDD